MNSLHLFGLFLSIFLLVECSTTEQVSHRSKGHNRAGHTFKSSSASASESESESASTKFPGDQHYDYAVFVALHEDQNLTAHTYTVTTDGNQRRDVQACSCAGGIGLGLQSYERDMSGCVGGCGGGAFVFHHSQTTVRSLEFWLGGENNGFKAIRITLFDGGSSVFGQLPASGSSCSYTFDVGEYVLGDITLGGNGIGTRTGFVKFATSKNPGNPFQCGTLHTPYYYSANGFMTGIYGQSGAEIDHLGFMFMKPIRSSELRNIIYPTITNYRSNLSPQINYQTVCNAGSTAQTYSISITRTVTLTKQWSVGVSFMVGASLSVTAGVPEVESVGGKIYWEASASATYTSYRTDDRVETLSFPVNVPARTNQVAKFTWWNSKCNLPFTGELYYVFTDGSSFAFPINGVYDGAYVSDVDESFSPVSLQPSENCGCVVQ
eukprot:TRINITY_DN15552_c0_g1_i1.p1 TRINITY_DN15552_c0_g1~~TRINITY_DN15552_c0_g1_i1.p1  ORF type:complete len:435 (+),score=44.23 TRINITY_DN15552_c0_g1_i1:114-1418(+)